MPYHAYEQPVSGGQWSYMATYATPREAADWLKDRAREIRIPDMAELQTANPVVRSYFAETRLANGEPIMWTVGTPPVGRNLAVQPQI
ncbi:hypothetical protein [Streptomonospora sediminis]